MASYHGVRPHKSQRGQKKITKWELDTAGAIGLDGNRIKTKKRVVNCDTAREAHQKRQFWLLELSALAPQVVLPTPAALVPGAASVPPYLSPNPTSPLALLTVAEYIEEHYLPWVEKEQVASTLRTKTNTLTNHVTPVIGDVLISQAGTPENVQKVRDQFIGQPPRSGNKRVGRLTVSSKNSVLAIYSGLLTHAASPYTDGGALMHKPVIPLIKDRTLQPGEERGIRDGYTTGGARHKRVHEALLIPLLEACESDADLVLIGLGLHCGLRRGEVAGLTWDDIDWDLLRLNIHSHVSSVGNIHYPYTKNGVPRVVPIESELFGALGRLYSIRRSDYVLPSPKCAKPSYHHIYDRYQTLTKYAWGIKGSAEDNGPKGQKRPYHALRHTYGSRLADKGFRPEQLQTLMGHISVKTTYGYISVDQDALQETAEALSLRKPQGLRLVK